MRISDWSSDVCSSDLLCVVFTMATALSLAACDGKPEKSDPVGQVIASVDGMEITQRDLVAEMDMIGPAEENPERAREAALQQIVVRKMLAKEAQIGRASGRERGCQAG